eukprot:gene4649-4902_t
MTSWTISSTVHDKRVYCTAIGTFKSLTPDELWRLLTLPEGAKIFRVEQRQLLSASSDGLGSVQEEVVFTAPIRVLFWKTWAKTRVHQCIDTRDPLLIKVNFRLIKSDLMSHLSGSWQLQAEQTGGATGNTVQTKVIYNFEMWPKGVPSSFRFMPGVLDAVKGAVEREAAQLFDKMQYVASKVGPGVPIVSALRMAAAEVARSGGSFKLLRESLSKRVPPDCDCAASCASQVAAVTSPLGGVSCHALDDADLYSDREGELKEEFVDCDSTDEQGDQGLVDCKVKLVAPCSYLLAMLTLVCLSA